MEASSSPGGGKGNNGDGDTRLSAPPPENALGNAHFARACGLGARGGWLEVEGAAALCAAARASPERAQGVKGEPHRSRRSRLEFHVKAGDARAVARLMDEGGEEAWAGWAEAPAAGGLAPARVPLWRWGLFAPLAGEEGVALRPAWRPKDHAAAAAALRERAPGGGPLAAGDAGEPDYGPMIKGPLAAWRAAHPGSEVANVLWRVGLTDADFVHLAGVKRLNMEQCTGVTDAGLAQLAGVHTLHMERCTGVTDAGLAHLRGIHTLNMRECIGITDAGLAHLRGIHTLGMAGCTGIIDAGFAHLRGIHTLLMGGCPGITGAGVAHLTGIHRLDKVELFSIGPRWDPATIAAARALGLYDDSRPE